MGQKISTAVIVFAIVLCCAILSISLYHSVRPGDAGAAMGDYIAGGVALIGIVLSAIAIKKGGGFKMNFSLGFVSCVFSLYLVEIAISLFFTETYQNLARRNGVPFDARTQWQVIQDLRTSGIDAYPNVHSSLFLESDGLMVGGSKVFPLGGISNQITVLYGNENGQFTVFKSDEHGFNNPQGLAGEADIVLIGDSFVQGYNVRVGRDIAAQLRKMGWGALNLGNGGSGPLLELGRLKEYASHIKPPLVFWVYFEGNDLGELENEKNSSILMNYVKRGFSQGLWEKQEEIDGALRTYVKQKEGTLNTEKNRETALQKLIDTEPGRIARLWYLRKRLEPYQSIEVKEPDFALFRQVLREAKRTTEEWGGRMCFVYLTAWQRYAKEVDQDHYFHRKEILGIVRELDLPIIDFHRELQHIEDPLSIFPFRVSGHYTAEGYRLVAASIDWHLRNRLFHTYTNVMMRYLAAYSKPPLLDSPEASGGS